jgi:hypothetical protein
MIIAAAEGIERANQLIGPRIANLIPHVSKDDLAASAGQVAGLTG